MTPSILEQRAYFPRGLYQPEGSFRFSEDALLLGSFAFACAPGAKLALEAGCGCGVAGFTLLLQNSPARLLGVDFQPGLLQAAESNAVQLGLTERFVALQFDLALLGQLSPARLMSLRRPGFSSVMGTSAALSLLGEARGQGGFDLFLANPPYRLLGSGRLPQNPLRLKALFAGAGDLVHFVAAASLSLKPGGSACFVFPLTRLGELARLNISQGLEPVEVVYVRGSVRQKAQLVLLHCVKKPMPEPELKVCKISLLTSRLESEQGKGSVHPDAAAFCPYLK